jgi:hypothetical protein
MKRLILALLLATACFADSPQPFFNGAVTNSAINVKAAPASFYGFALGNTTAAAVCYLQMFNTAAANVTLGTTVPVLSLPVLTPGTLALSFENSPVPFNVAMSIAATVTPTGNGVCAAPMTVNIFFL